MVNPSWKILFQTEINRLQPRLQQPWVCSIIAMASAALLNMTVVMFEPRVALPMIDVSEDQDRQIAAFRSFYRDLRQ